MKQDVIQASFTSGEFGPSLFGRTDIAQYANACAIVQNWLVRPFGSLISTPGTQFVNQCVTGGSTTLTGVRLIPFVFSVTDAYIIEIGAGYFRFYTNGAVVVSTGTTPYQISNNYAPGDISSIQYCQNHDVVYLFHGSYPPATITRTASNNWTFAAFPFTGGPFIDNPGGGDNSLNHTITPSGVYTGATITLVSNFPVFVPSTGSNVNHVGSFWSIGNLGTSSVTGLGLQGCVQITGVTSPSNATATVINNLISAGGIFPAGSPTTYWEEGSWSGYRGYPARCAFFQSRLFAARTNFEPQTVWGSSNFVFNNYAVNGGDDDDALNLQLSAVQGNDIKWMLGMNDLIVGTYGGEFVITAGLGTGNPLTPATAGVIPQTSWGSEPIIPKKIGNFVYYVQRGAQKLREIFYEWLSTTYKSVDKTIMSPQINGGAFVDMTYQQNPDTVLWAICSNGTIATMTREVDQQVQGWTRQVTQGSYISIASIPSQQGPYDEVWTIVTRTINGNKVNYIERFASQIVPMQGPGSLIPQQDQCFYVHCGLTYDGFQNTVTPTATSISIVASPSTSSAVVSSSSSYFSAGNVGLRLRAVDSYDNVLGEMTITGYSSSTMVTGSVSTAFTSPSYAPGFWGISAKTISGLNQLEQSTVVALGDGVPVPGSFVVSNGTITLPSDYFVLTAGLQATQIFVSLPKELPNERGTSVGKKQRISEVAFKVLNSYTGFYIGGTSGTLYPAVPSTPSTLYTGIMPNITFSDSTGGGYPYGAQLQIYNSVPLPIELLSTVITVDTQEK